MKRVILMGVLVLIPVIAGCQKTETFFYNPDKTLEQAQKDCETCHEPLVRATVGGTAYTHDYFESLDIEGDKCMERKGYTLVSLASLPDDICTTTLKRNLLRHNVAGK